MSSRLSRCRRGSSGFLTKTPVYLLLAFIGLLWLVPTLGLFITSLLEPAEITTTGWWKILSDPSLATLENYREVLGQQGDHLGHLDDALDLARGDDPPDLRRLDGRLRVRLARVPGTGLALRHRRRAPRRADPDGADPDLLALQRPRAVRHDPRARALPHRVRAPVRDLPPAQLLHRDPATCSRRRGSTAPPRFGSSSGSSSRSACRRSPRSRSSSSSGSGTTCSSRSRSRATRSRSRSRSSPRCASSAPTSSSSRPRPSSRWRFRSSSSSSSSATSSRSPRRLREVAAAPQKATSAPPSCQPLERRPPALPRPSR